jgi:hypothetical protein
MGARGLNPVKIPGNRLRVYPSLNLKDYSNRTPMIMRYGKDLRSL